MEFAFTDEQAMIAETVQAFFKDNATSERTRAAMEADGIDRELWASFCTELGLAGVGLPEDFGGAGLGMVEFAIVAEAAGAQVAALPLLGLATAARAIAAGGSEEQKAQWLPRLVSGETIAASQGIHGLTVAGNTLTGDVQFVPHGASADLFVFIGDDGAWIVRKDMPGVSAISHTTMDQTRPLATVSLAGVEAEPLADAAAARHALQAGAWICLAAEALGGAQETLDRTVAYSLERVQFGRAIGSFQAVKHLCAEMAAELEPSRSLVWYAAYAFDDAPAEAGLTAAHAKAHTSEIGRFIARTATEVHGGMGITDLLGLHYWFKRIGLNRQLLGGPERVRRIAARMQGLAA